MKKAGDIVLINGHEYVLGDKIGGGQEGSVFLMKDKPDLVIKLINTSKMGTQAKKELREHLSWLKNTIGAKEELKNKLAIPKELVDGDDIGYVMYRTIDSKTKEPYVSLEKYMTVPTDIQAFEKWYKENYKLKKRLQICSFLFNALELIHISGLLFTDLSPNNIMVNKDKNNLVFIDTDNMRRKRDAYLSVVGTEGYMAPEIYIKADEINKKLKTDGYNVELPQSGKLSVESDVFSAAVIAFRLLTLQHPFIGDIVEDGTAEEESAALRCETDYILHANKSNTSSNPFVGLLANCKTVTPKIKELFYRTFVDGKENPYARPSAMDFVKAFDEAQDLLATCENCGEDIIYIPKKENVCWDCEHKVEPRVVLRIYDKFEESDRDKLVADIFGVEPLCESDKKDPLVEICAVVLEENKDKYLYLRHFEKTAQRSKYFAKITLTDKISGTVRLQILDKSVIPSCWLIDRRPQRTRIPVDDLSKAKEFSMERCEILFDVVKSRVGKIETIGILSVD